MEQQRIDEKTRAQLWKDRLTTAAPVIVGIALFAAGLGALFHLLAPIDLRHVIATAKHTPPPVLAGALLATAGGYAALIGYDWSALRHIGRKLPLPVIAMGGFLGYSLGNTIGISILSGGAVRYRIYSAFGISALEIAAISTFVSLAFGVGISIIGLTALIIHPASLEQFTSLTPGKVQLIAALALALTIGLIGTASVAGRAIRIWRFELRAPSPGILLGQLFFTAIDTCLAALALYILIPPGGPDFVTFLVIFATAGMVGVLSHVPGGIGVFESVVIAALPPNVSVEQAAVGLLLFRIIYYLVPFVIAMVVISINEARLASGPLRRLLGDVSDTMRPVSGAMSSIAPAAAAASALGLGIYLLLMALMPSVRPIDAGPKDILGAVLLEGGAWLSAVLGLLMILLAQGLMRRISAAFLLTEIALIGGAAASLLNGVSISGALILLGAAVLIWPIRGEFYRAARLTQNLLSPGWFALMLGIALSAMLFLFLMQENTPYSHELLLRFSYNANAPRALRAGLAASALLCFVLIYLALQPARARPSPPDAAALERARAIIALQDDPLACLALAGDKSFLFAETGDAFIMYAAQGKSWIAYGDPIGNPAAVRDLAWAFFDAAFAAGCRPIFYEVSDAYRPVWVELGMTVNEIGEDASIDLTRTEPEDARSRAIRETQSRAEAEGYHVALLAPPHSADLLARLQDISDAWLAETGAREKRFLTGRFDAAYLQNFRIALLRNGEEILAFASLFETPQKQSATVDLLRFLPTAPDTTMQLLFTALIDQLRQEGTARFSLGLAPLAGLEARYGARLWKRFGAVLFKYGRNFYNFAGLRAYKQKYGPDWSPRYVAVPGAMPPLTALRDVTRAITGTPERRPRG